MQRHAPTVIQCITANPADDWMAIGPSRDVAEIHYMKNILSGQMRPPLYRIIVQAKIDQHQEKWPSIACH